MNLYSFSQQNNDEMGIHTTKENKEERSNNIYAYVQRPLTISKEIRLSVKKIDRNIEKESEKKTKTVQTKDNSKLLTRKKL